MRRFRKVSVALILVLFLTSCNKDRKVEHAFCHHVYFWLNNPADSVDRAQFEEGISELLKIDEIQMYHFGTPANTAVRDVVDGSYTYSYMVLSENKRAHDAYQTHPIHLKFVDKCSHLWKKVVVYDAESKK